MPNPDVVIVISGGNVQDVFASRGIRLQIIDFDNLNEGDVFDPGVFLAPDGAPNGRAARAVRAEAAALSARNQEIIESL